MLLGAGTAPAGATPVSRTFATPGSATFTVPTGIHAVTIEATGGKGGGGGGPSYVIQSATGVTSALATNGTDGTVTIPYDAATDGCAPSLPAPPSSTTTRPAAVQAVVAAPRFTG